MNKALYVHVPFCENICAYCDFTRVRCQNNLIDKWLLQFKKEINTRLNTTNFDTIYIGGGTPSALSVMQLEILLSLIKPYSYKTEEYTIEVNPENIDEDKIKVLKAFGINRVSIGVQSINQNILKNINRKHNNKMVIEAIELFKKHDITNISCDCMYGLPNQTIGDIKDTLDFIIDQNIPHISIYALTIEENSQFKRDGILKIDDELEADMYDFIVDYLDSKKFYRYEISNFAKEGFQSKHNKHYWHYDDFIGLSIGASGKQNNVRYENVRTFDKYFKGIYVEEEIILSKQDQIFEYIMMGLRLKDGFSKKEFENRFDVIFDDYYQNAIVESKDKDYLLISDDIIKCTDYGYNLLHNVLELFIL